MVFRNVLLVFVVILLCVISFMIVANTKVARAAKDRTFSSSQNITHHRVGVVLGTSKYYKGGGLNRYFKNRMDAAEHLFKSGKIDFILLSGDNGSISYNEPRMMRKELIKRGIPENVIFLDFAGFRTLDSVVRAKEIFDLNDLVFISQKFHNERAIYIAHNHGMNAVGFNAEDLEGSTGVRVRVREYFARAKAFLDILFDVEPKFYGEKIEIK